MKILILHASAGAGHKRAAQALGKGFAEQCPAAQIGIRDILDFTPPIFKKAYGERYLDVVKKVPELWATCTRSPTGRRWTRCAASSVVCEQGQHDRVLAVLSQLRP
jgi:hypothetical protein